MLTKRKYWTRQLAGAAIMILFVLLVEWMRKSDSNGNQARDENPGLDEPTSRPNTGELDF